MGGSSPGDSNPGRGQKKRRIGTTIDLKDFPEWFNENGTGTSQDVYLHVKSKDSVPIARRNRFIIAKILRQKTDKIIKASFNAEGDMILNIKGEKEADKILAMTSIGTWPVSVEKHKTLNSSKGVIFCPDMCWLKEQEVVEGLCDYKVTEVFFFKRIPRSTDPGSSKEPRPYGLAIITFNTQEPPKKIRYGFEQVEVRPYIPNPKKCRKCHKLGHTTRWCKEERETCAECGQENSVDHSCVMKMCVNCCKPGHASNSRDCPTYLMHKEWEAIMVLQRKTKYEAKQLFFTKYQNLEGFLASKNRNLAQIVGSPATSNMQTTSNSSNNKKSNNSTNNVTDDKEDNNQQKQRDSITKLSINQPQASNEDNQIQEVQKTTEPANNAVSKVDTFLKNSYVKLVDYKCSEKGITFILDNHIRGDITPSVNFSKFKGSKSGTKVKVIQYADKVFKRVEIRESILREVKKINKCNRIVVKMEDGKARVTAVAEEDDSTSEEMMSVEAEKGSEDEL